MKSKSLTRNTIPAFNLDLSRLKALKRIAIAAGTFVISLLIALLFLDRLLCIYIMVALLIHELGHFLAMKYFKYENPQIIFFFVIAITTTASNIESRFDRIVISLAGPVPGIIIGVMLLMLGSYLTEELRFFAFVLVGLNTFNLIPVSILDGGHVFEGLYIPNNNKKIGLVSMITGTGFLIYCLIASDYSIAWLALLIWARGILFIKHRRGSPLLEFKDDLSQNQKIILSAVWLISIFIALIALALL